MSPHEQEPRLNPSQTESEANRTDWDIPAIANALGNSGESRLDPLLGRGMRFRVGDPPKLELELFPAAAVVRLGADDLSLSLAETDTPKLAPAGIIFESRSDTAHRRLSIARTGSATFIYEPLAPSEAAESPTTEPDIADQVSNPDADQDLSDATLVAPEDAAEDPSPTPETPATNEEQPRVKIAGRLGTDPRFKVTKNEKVIASFPVAIRQEDGSTSWTDVKVFNERAARLRDQQTLKKGMFVEVTGYEHEKEITGKDGKTRTVKEIYGVVVKTR